MDNTLDFEQMLRLEATQLVEEGASDEGLARRLESLLERFPERDAQRRRALEELYLEYMPIIIEKDAELQGEPSDPGQLFARTPYDRSMSDEIDNREAIYNRLYGGWLGRIAGCILGKPVEGFPRKDIDELLSIQGESEVLDYFVLPSASSPYFSHMSSEQMRACTRGNINHAVADDDINYTILGLRVLEERGRTFTALDVMQAWMRYLPAGQTFTAERTAYRNYLNGLEPPECAVWMNPYREWIGAQIRADIWGYVNPGNAHRAAAMAYRDACISHRKNGLYGAMWAAACVAAAFTETETEKIVRAGLEVIPPASRLHEALERVLDWHQENPQEWRSCWQKIMERYGHYSPVHTLNNACFVVMGLLYGQKDFGRTIGIAVHAGFDTDCNGATAGSILGVVLGAKALPEKWVSVFHDTVHSTLAAMGREKISELARRTQITLDNPSLGTQTRL